MATDRQKRAAQKVSENIRSDKPKPVGELLTESGYSQSVSESPTLVTESKGFKKLLDEYLPDKELQKVHKGLLNASRIEQTHFPKDVTDEDLKGLIESIGGKFKFSKDNDKTKTAYWVAPNDNSRQNALKLAYEIKGQLKPEELPPETKTQNNFFIADGEVREEFIRFFKKKVLSEDRPEPTSEPGADKLDSGQ